MKWKEILADKNLPDDFVIALPDGKSSKKLGEFRAENAETEGETARRLAEIERREKELNQASIGLASLVEQLQAKTGYSFEQMLSGAVPTRKEVAKVTELDENDPINGLVIKEIKQLRQQVATALQGIDETRKSALGPMLNTYLEDFYENRWDKLSPHLPQASKLTLKDTLEYAQKNKLTDVKGRWDMERALRDLTYEDRVQAEVKRRAEAEIKKQQDEARMASIPKPHSLGQLIKTDKSLQKQVGNRMVTKNFDDVLNDAMNDSDLWKQIAGQGSAA